MRFLLFDRDENYIGTVKDVTYARHLEEINGEDTLTLETLETTQVEKNQRIVYRTRTGHWKEFIVKEIHETHGHYGIRNEIYCESSFYETLGDYINDRRPNDVTATAALLIALEPTRWEVGTVHDLGLRSTSFYRSSCKECVHKIAEVWGGEIQTRATVSGNRITARHVDILGRRGGDYGRRFTYTKDLIDVRRTMLRDDVLTALYGYGKGEFIEETGGWGRRIDFADLNEGLPYVTNEEARLVWGRNDGVGGKAHVFGKAEFDDCEDPAELLELTIARLAQISQPQVAYDCRVLDLGTVDLGDNVRVIDKEFDPELRVNARVISIDRDLLEEERSEVTFGNYRPGITDAMNDADAYLNQFRDRAGVWDRSGAFNSDGSLDADWLNDLIAELNSRMNSQGGYVYVSDDGQGLTTYDKPADQGPTKAIQLLGGAFRIANGKLPNGDWNWRTFGDGDGFIADLIVAGMLQGGNVKWNLTDGTLLIGQSSTNYQLYWDGSTLNIRGRIHLSDGTDLETAIQDLPDDMSYIYEQLGGHGSSIEKIFEDDTISPTERLQLEITLRDIQRETEEVLAKLEGEGAIALALSSAAEEIGNALDSIIKEDGYSEVVFDTVTALFKDYIIAMMNARNAVSALQEIRFGDIDVKQIALGDRIGNYERQLLIEPSQISMQVAINGVYRPAMTLTQDELAFYSGTHKVSYFAGQQMLITNAVILGQLEIGNHVVEGRGNEYTIFRWAGAT